MNKDVLSGSPCRLMQFEGELRPDHVEALDGLTGLDSAPHVLVDCRRVTRYREGALEALVAFEQRTVAAGGKVLLVGIRHPSLPAGAYMESVCRVIPRAERASA